MIKTYSIAVAICNACDYTFPHESRSEAYLIEALIKANWVKVMHDDEEKHLCPRCAGLYAKAQELKVEAHVG